MHPLTSRCVSLSNFQKRGKTHRKSRMNNNVLIWWFIVQSTLKNIIYLQTLYCKTYCCVSQFHKMLTCLKCLQPQFSKCKDWATEFRSKDQYSIPYNHGVHQHHLVHYLTWHFLSWIQTNGKKQSMSNPLLSHLVRVRVRVRQVWSSKKIRQQKFY